MCGNCFRRIELSLRALHRKVGRLMSTQSELTQQLDAVNARLTKIGTEITALHDAVAALQTALADAPATPELQAAVDRVAAQTGVLDELNPDNPT